MPNIDPSNLQPGERLVVQQVAQLTGVSRERLRTWERRHGFPEPERRANNVRTYTVAEIPRIVSVARLIENGYPVGEAIAAVVDGSEGMTALGEDGVSLDHAPLPAIAVAGTSPADLRVVWANTTTRVHPESHEAAGDLHAWAARLGAPALTAVFALLTDPGTPAPVTLAHIDWVGTFPAARHSLVWRATTPDGPCVVLMQLPESMLAMGEDPVAHDAVTSRWSAAVGAGRQALQGERGLASAQHALRELVSGCGALDGLLVLRHGGGLRSASSVRGTVGARAVAPTDCPDLAAAINQGELRWLDHSAQASFGLPSYLALVAVPLGIGGQTIGSLVLSFPQQLALTDTVSELLQMFGSAVAAAIQRERQQTRQSSIQPVATDAGGRAPAQVAAPRVAPAQVAAARIAAPQASLAA